MKKSAVLAAIAALLLIAAATVYAAGSVTEAVRWIDGQNTKIVTITWVGDASDGSVPDVVIPALDGYLLRVVTDPGTPAPDPYDVTLIEHLNGSLDLFSGRGANRSATATEHFMPHHNNGTINVYPVFSATPLTFGHANGTTNSATGQVILYVDVPK